MVVIDFASRPSVHALNIDDRLTRSLPSKRLLESRKMTDVLLRESA